MSKHTRLSKKQLDVINDLFATKLSENEILQKHKVRRTLYNKWLEDENFMKDFDNRIVIAIKRNAARLAENASEAVEKLITMSGGDKEISRKACIDIITLQKQVLANHLPINKETKSQQKQCSSISDEAAGKILAVLAEEK